MLFRSHEKQLISDMDYEETVYNFQRAQSALEQKGALLALLRELKRQFPKALVVGHRDLNPMKGCPCFDAVKEYAEITSF